MSYKVEAALGNTIEEVILESMSDDRAVIEAIDVIMDNAYADKSGPWAIGEITLTDPAGNVLQSMAAK